MNQIAVSEFFAASCTPEGGAYRYCLYENGQVELLQKIPMDRAKYLALQNGILYATLIAPFPGRDDSGVLCVDLSGKQIGEIISAKGHGICHIAVCEADIYAANYGAGSLIKLPDTLVIHEGCGVNPDRQEKPHVHSVFLSPCKNYVLSCDLGTDDVYVYARDMTFVSKAKTPLGVGPRHLCFSKCGRFVYCLNEMGGSISVFAWESGCLAYLHTLSILPPDFSGEGAAAAIKLSRDGKRLYASERASNRIVTLEVNGAELTVLAHTNCGGDHPRDLELLAQDKYCVCTNLFSDNMAVFRMDENGVPVQINSISLAQPLCAIEM